MATDLTPKQMKAFVRQHFEDFVNNKKAEVIQNNMTPDFYDHDGPGGQPTDRDGERADDAADGYADARPAYHHRQYGCRRRPRDMPQPVERHERGDRQSDGVSRFRRVAF